MYEVNEGTKLSPLEAINVMLYELTFFLVKIYGIICKSMKLQFFHLRIIFWYPLKYTRYFSVHWKVNICLKVFSTSRIVKKYMFTFEFFLFRSLLPLNRWKIIVSRWKQRDLSGSSVSSDVNCRLNKSPRLHCTGWESLLPVQSLLNLGKLAFLNS